MILMIVRHGMIQMIGISLTSAYPNIIHEKEDIGNKKPLGVFKANDSKKL